MFQKCVCSDCDNLLAVAAASRIRSPFPLVYLCPGKLASNGVDVRKLILSPRVVNQSVHCCLVIVDGGVQWALVALFGA